MKKSIAMALAVLLSLGAMASCGSREGNKQSTGVSAGGNKASDIHIAMVTDIGGINDESFNQSAWNGMEKLKKEAGYDVSFVESHKEADYKPNLENLVDKKPNLIWGIGFLMKTAVTDVAKAYPDETFALVDDFWNDGEMPNTIGVMFHSEESSFLVGYIAGMMTKTDHVGFVLGMESPTMNRFQYGYEAGVYSAGKERGKTIKVDAVTIQTFGDTAKGKATAQKMYSDGADIVFHAAGQAGSGVIEAAKDAGKYVIGVDLDQNKLAPDNVITSALKNVDTAVFDISKKVAAGEKLGGKTLYFGLKDGGVGIAPTSSKHVPAEILDKTKAIEKKIIAGELKVPITAEEYKAFAK